MGDEQKQGTLSNAGQYATPAAAIVALAAALSSLGIDLGAKEPAATQAELHALEENFEELEDAVRELTYQIRRHHGDTP